VIGRVLKDRLAAWSLNPVMIKELRQLVRSRFMSSIFLLVLAVLATATGIFLAARSINELLNPSRGMEGGQVLFSILLTVLDVGCLVFIPAYVGIRLTAERSDSNVDLLFITALTPGAILRGKFYAGLALVGLIFSACVPFMAFTYLLRGIDMGGIFLTLLYVFLQVAVALQLGLFVGALPVSKPFKTVLGLLALLGVFAGPVSLSVMSLSMSGGAGASSFWPSTRVILVTITIALSIIWLLHTLAAAFLSPPASNRAFPVRFAVTVIWALGGAGAAWCVHTASEKELILIWLVPSMLLCSLAAAIAVSERTVLGPRIAHAIPRSRVLRLLAFPFYTGMASGLFWVGLIAALTLVGGHVVRIVVPGKSGDLKEGLLILETVFLYVLAYSLTAFAFGRRFMKRLVAAGRTWLLVLIMISLGALVPSLVGIFFFKALPERAWEPARLGVWQMGSIFGVFDETYRPAHLRLAAIWVALAFLFCVRSIWRQMRAFRPTREASDSIAS